MYVGKVDGIEFEIKPSQTILEAQYPGTLPYGCRRSCDHVQQLSGGVFHEDIMPGVLTDQDE